MSTPLTTRTPSNEPRGGVVVVQEAFGVTDHIVGVCQRFADAGWTAVAPHLFHRQDVQVYDYADKDAAIGAIGGLNASEIDTDIDAAFTELAEGGLEPDRCAIVGFCMGGSVAFQTAVRRPLGAAATFYGGGISTVRFGYPTMLSVAEALQTPWHGLFGDLDKGIPVVEVEQLRVAASAAPVPNEITRYAEGEHGFHCDDRPTVYNPDAAADAWAKTLRWFDTHVAR